MKNRKSGQRSLFSYFSESSKESSTAQNLTPVKDTDTASAPKQVRAQPQIDLQEESDSDREINQEEERIIEQSSAILTNDILSNESHDIGLFLDSNPIDSVKYQLLKEI